MVPKYIALAITVVQAIRIAEASDYWQSWTSKVDPTKIVLPKIPQTTSYDEEIQCTWYDPTTLFDFDPAEWPSTWELATSNGMDRSAEFMAMYNSIDWSAMPPIPVRKAAPGGGLDMSSYDQTADPDCWWSATTCTSPKHAGINPDIYSCPEPETWGLNFDDGPNCSHNAFYDYLESNKLRASMFYIGSNVVNWPYGAIRGVRDGHHLASHTWSHSLMTTLTSKEVLAELFYTQKAIKVVTGVTPRHWRPAFGDIDDRVRWIATQLDMTAIIWDLDTDDWAAGVTEPVSVIKDTYRRFIKMGTDGTFAKHGNIVLQHEINNSTMQLAVSYLPQIQAAYKHVVDIATCMNISYPYMETQIEFQSFADAIKTSVTTTKSNVTKTTTVKKPNTATSKNPAATTTKSTATTTRRHTPTATEKHYTTTKKHYMTIKKHAMTTTTKPPRVTPHIKPVPEPAAMAAEQLGTTTINAAGPLLPSNMALAGLFSLPAHLM